MAERDVSADEMTKLTAAWCNTLSAGAIVVGVFTPIFQLQDPAVVSRAGWGLVISSVIYLFAGVFTHIAGRVMIELRFRP